MTKRELREEIQSCYAIASNQLEHLGDRDIKNLTSYFINEIIDQLEKMKKFVQQHNSIEIEGDE